MGSQPPFARAHAWWSWHHPRIVRAVAGAAHEHLLDVIRGRLSENSVAGRAPNTVDALIQSIRRNPRNADRIMSGESCPSDGFRLALATALNVCIRDLIPNSRSWIAKATQRLCDELVSDEEAGAYALFRVNGEVGDDSDAVEKVIASLDTVLVKIDRDLTTK